MEKKGPLNFVDNIHNEQYDTEYYNTLIQSDSMIYDNGRNKEKLSGNWNFCIDVYDSCLRSKWFLEETKDKDGRDIPIDFYFDGWEEIKVPSVWNTSKPEYYYYEGPAVYSRTFKYKNKGEKSVVIKFAAVYYEAKVFINSVFVGCHKGGSTPFFIDITKHLKEENRIIVVADNQRKKENVPTINTDWFNYGGIYRDVELLRLPEKYIKDFTINLANDSLDTIEFMIEVNEHDTDECAYLHIKELDILEEIELINGIGKVTIKPEEKLKLWSPESPFLYSIKVIFEGDRIREKIGFRQIKVVGNEIILNNKPIFLKGVCTHEESVVNGKSISEEEIIENIKIAKQLNANFIRLAHYPHTERTAQIADELGILLWEEIPVYWAIDFSNAQTYKDASNQLSELIKRDKNRASVIVWSVGNENPDTDARLEFMKNLAIQAKTMDKTRLISAACLINHVELKIEDRLEEYLDVVAVNEYYGWYNPNFDELIQILNNSKPTKPVVISEFGGDGISSHYGTTGEMGTETCQENIYKTQVEMFSKTNFIKGTMPWILYDFRCPRRFAKGQNGYNIKGLLSRDKKHKKLAFYVMKEFYKNKK